MGYTNCNLSVAERFVEARTTCREEGPKAVNAQEAADILGVNRRRHGDLLEMLRALTLYPWLNTAEDEKRRVAVRWVLTHWKE
jgi:hypothetical protein